jgi:hypothetical protein
MPNYLKHYQQLCFTRKQLGRSKTDDHYYEKHHILPRSLGGTNDPSNLVLLTAREHFIAHLLLYFHYRLEGGKTFQKMCFALVSMSSTNKNLKRPQLSSRQYAFIREAAQQARQGVKVLNTEKYKQPKTEAHKQAIREARLRSTPRSLKTRTKMKESALARGSNFKGNYTKVSCPHCYTTGQTNAMMRWHFNNCKEVNHA